MQILRGRKTGVEALAVSPDSRFVAVGGLQECHVWDTSARVSKPGRPLNGNGAQSVHFTADARLFVGSGNLWCRYDALTGEQTMAATPGWRYHQNAILHPSGGLVKAVDHHAGVLNFSVTAGGLEPGPGDPVAVRHPWLVGFDPDGGRYLIQAAVPDDSARTHHLFATATDLRVTTFGHPENQHPISPSSAWAFSPDGRRLFLGFRQVLAGYDCAAGGPARVTAAVPKFCYAVAAHPSGRLLATVEDDSAVTFRDADTLGAQRSYDFKMPTVTCVAFTPDGTRCVIGNSRGKVLLFDVD